MKSYTTIIDDSKILLLIYLNELDYYYDFSNFLCTDTKIKYKTLEKQQVSILRPIFAHFLVENGIYKLITFSIKMEPSTMTRNQLLAELKRLLVVIN